MITKISDWGRQVKTRFRLDNALEQVAGGHQPTEVLLDNVVRLQGQNDLLKEEVANLRQVNVMVFEAYLAGNFFLIALHFFRATVFTYNRTNRRQMASWYSCLHGWTN